MINTMITYALVCVPQPLGPSKETLNQEPVTMDTSHAFKHSNHWSKVLATELPEQEPSLTMLDVSVTYPDVPQLPVKTPNPYDKLWNPAEHAAWELGYQMAVIDIAEDEMYGGQS